MRTLTSALTFFFILGFTSCKKDSSTAPPPTNITGSIEPALTSGDWRVGFFSDNGTDNTANYTNFKLDFNKNGAVTANNDTIVFTGSWWTSTVEGRLKLNLDFVNQGSFEYLTHDWTVTQQGPAQIKMTNVNNSGTDFLTLNKNLIK